MLCRACKSIGGVEATGSLLTASAFSVVGFSDMASGFPACSIPSAPELILDSTRLSFIYRETYVNV